MTSPELRISPFGIDDGERFSRLNLAWLVGHQLLETTDEQQLADPQAHVFDHGGEIFMARIGDVAVGCCAVIPRGDGSIEVAKLAVERAAQGRGIGRRLVETVLAWGQQRHYTRAVLTSSRKLETALRLYESIGFRHAPMPEDVPYKTADVYMELDLTAW